MTASGKRTVPVTEESDFPFDTLSGERNEIRILYLLPGFWADVICCDLITVSLDNKPLYQALSYAWGHHSTLSSIRVGHHTVRVTPSLEAALRQIRQHENALPVWVDKLCINQNDEKEKSKQVAMMHRVFQQCSNVLIWLGPAESPVQVAERHDLLRRWSQRSVWTGPQDTVRAGLRQWLSILCSCIGKRTRHLYGKCEPSRDQLANIMMKLTLSPETLPAYDEEALEDPFAIVVHFAADKHISELPCFYQKGKDGKLVFRETAQFQAMWLSFRQLLETSWHSRLWCVQEALLPKNAWVLYGDWRIPFSTIMDSVQNHRRHLFTCCSKAEKLFGSTYAFVPDSLYRTPPAKWDLDMLLRTFRYKDCRDPRDKVYGIFALLDGTEDITVDYARSVNAVYTHAMCLIINQSHGELRFLTGSGFGDGSHGLPSWVRNLAKRPSIAAVQTEMRRLEAYDLYDAANGMEGQELMQTGRALRVSGVAVDSIAHICPPMDVPIEQLDWKHAAMIILNWHRAAKSAGDNTSLLRPDVCKQRFWRTILCDLIWVPEQIKFRRFNEEDIEMFEQWLRQCFRSWLTWRQPNLIDSFVQPLVCATYGRCLFVTTTGHIGLCYPTAQPGDQVWIVKGCKVPLIFRPESTLKTASQYGLVGDCYLHEHMDGKNQEHETTLLTIL